MYDVKQLKGVTAAVLQVADVPFDQATQVGQPGFLPLGKAYDVAYNPADGVPSPQREARRSALKRTGDKSAPGLATSKPRRGPSRDKADQNSLKEMQEFWAAKKEFDKARAKLDGLNQAVRSVTSAVMCLNPEAKREALAGEVKIDLEHMMEQLNELNTEVQQDRSKFEVVVTKRYDALIARTQTIHRKLNELVYPRRVGVGATVLDYIKRHLYVDRWP